jgi:hypothetical protein
MMIIILVLLIISFVHVKSQAEKNSSSSIRLNFSKKNIILVVSVLVLILAVGYVRWLRIERELNLGLISHTELPEVEARLHSIFDSYFSDLKNNKHTLLIFLRGKSCVSCLTELDFWKRTSIYSNVKIVGVFINITKNDIKWFEEILKIPFEMRSLNKEIFLEIIGKHPAVINRLFFTKNGKYILAKAANDDENEKKSFLYRVMESIE